MLELLEQGAVLFFVYSPVFAAMSLIALSTIIDKHDDGGRPA